MSPSQMEARYTLVAWDMELDSELELEFSIGTASLGIASTCTFIHHSERENVRT